MDFYAKSVEQTISDLNSDAVNGLTDRTCRLNREKYGLNKITKGKKAGIFKRIITAVSEPMLIILLFGFVITLGTNIGKHLVTGDGDFIECLGILFAVILSVSITLIMEGTSQKAFNALNRIYDNVAVRVIRSGKIITISQTDVTVGDVVIIESGDKIIADGRLIESENLTVDESALTGESNYVKKDADSIKKISTPLAERENCVYSGTFVTGGSGKMVVTAIGDKTEIGAIARELSSKELENSPLQIKLAKLGKIITIIGTVSAISVFIISIMRLVISGSVSFSSVQDLAISCIVMIVAAVPEGLPTIVAVSLALNMIKLAKGNALIKKMTATETAGAVSVICSDKTGTLTENKMSVVSVCLNQFCVQPEKVSSKPIIQNFILNSTADVIFKNKRPEFKGSATECALITAYQKSNPKVDYREFRKQYQIIDRKPFDSEDKYMTTTIKLSDGQRKLIKGAPEKVLSVCNLTPMQIKKLLSDMKEHQKKARRIICFAHLDGDGDQKYTYDGYVSIADPLRKDVVKAVNECKRAGIKVKILTGDNMNTAISIARELNLITDESQVVNASDLEKLDDETFLKIIKRVNVIARSTPGIKLRVVRGLKNLGEVVAVTGDGINDAPAIKHADVGIAMGISGSEISKEAADVVLLDDSFSTVVKAIAFGRNVYKNIQRFILFQLSVNFSAIFFIILCAVFNLRTPFNTLQLLWINVIMDGPPALTLGLESANKQLMTNKPIKRDDSIVTKTMLYRIVFNGLFIGTIILCQYATNFLGVLEHERSNAVFTLFILFQLFIAFASREIGAESIFRNISKNKVMLLTFLAVFVFHFVIVQYFSVFFSVNAMSFSSWISVIAVSLSIVVISELYKLAYRWRKGKREIKKRK